MQNDMRDRLVELIVEKENEIYATKMYPSDMDRIGSVADHLIANGVILPPCKVGDTVYIPWVYDGISGVAFFDVTFVIFDRKKPYIKTNFDTDDNGFWDLFNGGTFYFDDFGKTVFITKDQAEQKLKEMRVENG